MKKSTIATYLLTISLLIALTAASDGAVNGAKQSLRTCAEVIIPCLFPFFVISYLAGAVGLPVYIGQKLHKPMALLFSTSGTGAGVFILGILGGYPLGAAVIADLVQKEDLTTEEGQKLLCFCNNSGPAFLIGAIGIGIFHSAPAGVLLYSVHILAAIITGMFLSGTKTPCLSSDTVFIASVNLSSALPDSIARASTQIVQICGYVIFFGAVVGTLEETGVFSALYGPLSTYTALTLQQAKALCSGILELGCGIGSLLNAPLSPQSLSLCAFLTGFGGLSVCMQTAGMLVGTGLKLRYHILGRLCCAGIAAFLMFTFSSILW